MIFFYVRKKPFLICSKSTLLRELSRLFSERITIGQASGQERVVFDDGLAPADDIADRGVGQVVLDIGLQFLPGLGLGVGKDGRVKACRPAFRVTDRAAGDKALRQWLRVYAADGDGIQAFLVFILFVAGVHLHPTVGVFVFGAA